ncbi:hypothetical protein [Luteolibacter soli]|uniref:Uncharacterized protein n=1 Tax=Luteolibacter soli TaxID=3135280 RepID=A0ABU9AV33_9BACT
MHCRPLPIPGLPLAPSADGLTVLDDVLHATSSHPRRPIAPLPLWLQPAPVIPAAPANLTPAPAPADPVATKQRRWYPHGEQPRPQQQQQQPGTSRHLRNHRPRFRVPATVTSISISQADELAADLDDELALFRSRHHIEETPRLTSDQQPDAPAARRHSLSIHSPLDAIRLFPMPVSAAALLAAVCGLLSGRIANLLIGPGFAPPLWFAAGYLLLFALHLLTHCFLARSEHFFASQQRFLRLLAANALILLPHFIAWSILRGMMAK